MATSMTRSQWRNQGRGSPEHRGGGVQVQVAEKDMEAFVAKLSKGCNKRFSEMLEGKGPPIHTFGNASMDESGKVGCKDLHGAICSTGAYIMEAKETPGGRTMTSTVDVKGDSCLPNECMAENDLTNMAKFMLRKAGEVMPVNNAQVELHVDCVSSGGAKVVVYNQPGAPSKVESKELPKVSEPQLNETNTTVAPKSGSTPARLKFGVPTFFMLLGVCFFPAL